MTPFAKTGGLADVSSALSAYLHRAGHQILPMMPRYAMVDSVARDIQAVEGMQDLSVTIGPWDISYSIDEARLPGTSVPVFLLRCPQLYGRPSIYTNDADEHLRFVLLSRVAIEFCQHRQFAPDIFHVHDWHTALVPLYLKTVYAWDRLFAATRSVLTIHNIGYQGVFSSDILHDLDLGGAEGDLHQEDLRAGQVNFLKTGLLHADLVTAVSPTYAREIQRPEYGMGLDQLLRQRADSVVGILNGVDYDEWNPETDPFISANYSKEDLRGKWICKRTLLKELQLVHRPRRPLISIVSRLVGQKGIDLIMQVVPRLLGQRDFSLAVLGTGERRYESFFEWLQDNVRDRVCFYRGYNNELAHWMEAGSDIFLMPSLYEPCGLNQMYSLKYGTVPVVRETGGLADSVEPVSPLAGTGTGIVFRDYDEAGLDWALNTALDLYANKRLWRRLITNGMSMDFSWERQGGRYVELFRQLVR